MKTPLIIAHRGASAVAPENTIAAFRRAIEVGADGVEFDVRLARDGVPVVIHDSTLERTAGLKRGVSDLTSEELSQIDVGSWFYEGGNATVRERAYETRNECVPTLVRTLEVLAGLNGPIYLEIKIDSAAEIAPLTDAVARVISASALLPKTIVQSFDLRVLTHIRKHLPQIQTSALFGQRVMHFVRGRSRIIDLALQHGANHLSLHRSLVNKRMISLATEAGLPVTVWTVDDWQWIVRAAELGVYALITNDPASIRKSKPHKL